MNITNVKKFYFSWTAFLIVGCLGAKFLNLPIYEGLFRFVGNSGFELSIAILAFRFSVEAEDKKKYFLILFGISFIFECIFFASFNITLNILRRKSPFFPFFYEIPYFFVLLFQIAAFWMIKANCEPMQSKKNVINFSFLISALFIMLIFIFCLSWRINFNIPSGIFIFINATLQAFCFALISSYLVTLRNNAILYISLGFIIMIASDYSMRVNEVEYIANMNNVFQIIWIIGLAFILYGFIIFKSQDLKISSNTWFYPTNSIQSKIALWNFKLCIFSIVIFTSLISIIIWPYHAVYDTIKYLPSILILLTTSTILISTKYSKNLLTPLNSIYETIAHFSKGTSYLPDSEITDKGILEYMELNKFLNNSFIVAKEKLNVEKKLSELALNVAHDIRSPVSTIEMIVSSLADLIPLQHKNILLQSTQNVRQIANDLLKRYRDPIGTQENSGPQDMDSIEKKLSLSSIIEFLIKQKRQEWSHNPCNITFTIDSEAKLSCITAIRNDLERILSNLLNNAHEALQDRREIYISLTLMEDKLQLIIEDTGSGVPNDLISSILDGVSLKHSGKGLGLSGAKNYMESIGGKLLFASVQTSGSEVTLIFPLSSN